MYYRDPAQDLITAGEDLDGLNDLDRDLSDLSDAWSIMLVPFSGVHTGRRTYREILSYSTIAPNITTRHPSLFGAYYTV